MGPKVALAAVLVGVVAAGIGCGGSGSARHAGRLPGGQSVDVVRGQNGTFCVVVKGLAKACGNRLSASSPISFGGLSGNSAIGTPPVAFGVTRSGVVAVSFVYDGKRFSVPVRDNFFSVQGTAAGALARFSCVTVTFRSGKSKMLSGRGDCQAVHRSPSPALPAAAA